MRHGLDSGVRCLLSLVPITIVLVLVTPAVDVLWAASIVVVVRIQREAAKSCAVIAANVSLALRIGDLERKKKGRTEKG